MPTVTGKFYFRDARFGRGLLIMDGLLAKGVNLGDNITVRRLGQLPRLDRKDGILRPLSLGCQESWTAQTRQTAPC